MNSILLTIAIPTYNRSHKLAELLQFLDSELLESPCSSMVEILVSDNHSDDDTQLILNDFQIYHKCKCVFRINVNSKNIGLVGNLLKMIQLARGEYIWMPGDDDVYHKNIISVILSTLSSRTYSFVFINHCLYRDHIGDETYQRSMLEGIDVTREDQDVLLDITRLHGTPLMYISAVIHKTEYLKEMESYNWEKNLAYPLLMSFYSASKGKTKLIPEILIDDIIKGISWENSMKTVFFSNVPYVLNQLGKLNYSRDWKKVRWLYLDKRGLTINKKFKKFVKRITKGFIKFLKSVL